MTLCLFVFIVTIVIIFYRAKKLGRVEEPRFSNFTIDAVLDSEGYYGPYNRKTVASVDVTNYQKTVRRKIYQATGAGDVYWHYLDDGKQCLPELEIWKAANSFRQARLSTEIKKKLRMKMSEPG